MLNGLRGRGNASATLAKTGPRKAGPRKARPGKAAPGKAAAPAKAVPRPVADDPSTQRRGSGVGARIVRALVGTVALFAFTVCAAVVLKLTLTSSPASVGIAHTNLDPGKSIRLYLDQPSVREAALQIGGNILIGVPFGLLLPMITPRARGLLRVVLTTAFVVLVLELAQHFFVRGRSFDVDDLILAAVGAVVGYVPVGRYLSLRVHPGHRHWWQRLLGTRKRTRATA